MIYHYQNTNKLNELLTNTNLFLLFLNTSLKVNTLIQIIFINRPQSGTLPNVKQTRKLERPDHKRPKSFLSSGTVLILLAGRFRGKKFGSVNAERSTLLVSGPFKVNGVPLRRVNVAYVITTSTKIDVSSVNVEKFNKAYFAREKVTTQRAEG